MKIERIGQVCMVAFCVAVAAGGMAAVYYCAGGMWKDIVCGSGLGMVLKVLCGIACAATLLMMAAATTLLVAVLWMLAFDGLDDPGLESTPAGVPLPKVRPTRPLPPRCGRCNRDR